LAVRMFVFGSNLAGRHGKGSAHEARLHHGAVYGIGEGPTGRAYAIPTKDYSLQVRPLEDIARSVERFKAFARSNPQITFDVCRVGCMNAGYADADIAPMFADAPENCVLPEGWR
jgi:hypothetical protein